MQTWHLFFYISVSRKKTALFPFSKFCGCPLEGSTFKAAEKHRNQTGPLLPAPARNNDPPALPVEERGTAGS